MSVSARADATSVTPFPCSGPLPAAGLETLDEPAKTLRCTEGDEVGAARPAGEPGEVGVAGRDVADRDHVGADQAGVAPLVLKDLGGEGTGGENEDEVLGVV